MRQFRACCVLQVHSSNWVSERETQLDGELSRLVNQSNVSCLLSLDNSITSTKKDLTPQERSEYSLEADLLVQITFIHASADLDCRASGLMSP